MTKALIIKTDEELQWVEAGSLLRLFQNLAESAPDFSVRFAWTYFAENFQTELDEAAK